MQKAANSQIQAHSFFYKIILRAIPGPDTYVTCIYFLIIGILPFDPVFYAFGVMFFPIWNLYFYFRYAIIFFLEAYGYSCHLLATAGDIVVLFALSGLQHYLAGIAGYDR